jgi:ABC-type phosphate transport system permease subunit
LALFINVFGLPRSAPIVGGVVLSLMTLPVIIIASRAALTAVPPSIREAALGIGASKMQTVLHHVLPLAMPGMLTGTIIGMARALGESAPLLMIGMVAFIVDVPTSPLSPATALGRQSLTRVRRAHVRRDRRIAAVSARHERGRDTVAKTFRAPVLARPRVYRWGRM